MDSPTTEEANVAIAYDVDDQLEAIPSFSTRT